MGNKEKTDSDNAGSKVCRTVFQRSRMLLWRRAEGNRPKKQKEFKDDYRRRDTYHQSEKKGRYRRRERQDRERTKPL